MMREIHTSPRNRGMHLLLSITHRCIVSPLIKKMRYHFSDIENSDLFAHPTPHFSTKVWTRLERLMTIVSLYGTLCLALLLNPAKIDM